MGGRKIPGARRMGLWLAVAAAVTLLVALAPPAPNAAAVVQSVPRAASAGSETVRSRQAVPALVQTEVLRLLPRLDIDAARGDGGLLWAMPPPAPPAAPPARSVARAPAVVAAAPPPPAAPALPFRLVGRYADGGREGVILQGPEGEVFIAHAGETLAGNYRVESLSGNLMVLHYLPLDLRQTMDIGVSR